MASDFCRLGDLVSIKHGWPFKSELFSEELTGKPILVNIGNFNYTGGFRFGSTRVKEYRGEYPKEYELVSGDVLLVMTCQTAGGEILGIPGRIPEDGRIYLHNQRMGKLVMRQPDKVDRDYLYYLFISPKFNRHLFDTASGTKILHTSPARIEAFSVSLPPLLEQRHIAALLRSLDEKIDLNQRMNETLEAIARAIFKSWFVDFDFSTTSPGNFQLTDLVQIAEIIDCLHSKKPDRQQTGKPLLQLWNIRDDGLMDMTDTYFISERDYELWISRMEARQGDCVITNVGRVAAIAQVPAGVRAAMGRNMTGLRCRPEYPYPTFLIQALTADAMQEEIALKVDSGTILDSLNVRSIPHLRLVLPPQDLLRKFESACRPIRARMELNIGESHNLALVRDTLLPKLMSGAIRIKDAEKIVEAHA